MADKCIGKLTLDIKDVQKQIEEVNGFLSQIGANVNVKDIVGKRIKEALQNLVNEAKKAGAEAQKAISESTKVGADTKELEAATKAWAEYYKLMTKAQNAASSHKTGLSDYYKDEAEKVVKDVQSLREYAEAQKTVADAMRSYNAAVVAGRDKAQAESLRESARAAKEAEKAYRDYHAELERNQKAEARAQALIDKQEIEDRNAALEAYIELYRRKIAMDTEATKAAAAGNVANANLYLDEERKIESQLALMRQLVPELEKWAQEDERVAQAELKREAAVNTAKQKSEELDYKAQQEAVAQYANALEALYNAQAKFNSDVASGKLTPGTNAYEDSINNLQRLGEAAESAGASLSESSRREAEDMDRVTVAVQKATDSFGLLKDAQANSQAEADANKAEENAKKTEAYALALETLYNAQEKLNRDLASGRLTQGSDDYEYRIRNLADLREKAEAAGAAISEQSRREAESMDNVTDAVQRATASFGALRDARANNDATAAEDAAAANVKRAEDAYKQLTIAIQNYNKEKSAGNTDRMALWQNEINKQAEILSGIEKELDSLGLNEEQRQRILTMIEQAKTAQGTMTKETENTNLAAQDMNNQFNMIAMRVLSLTAIIRVISDLIKNTSEYVSEYYDQMNEIRIITGATEEEAEKLGDTYRRMAADMSVSSTEMAKAAIYFTRQGLSAGDIEDRLKNVTMYAKTANIEFEQAAELMTAVINSMDLEEEHMADGRTAAERVADVFLNIGDNAATSGEEIGRAMQKASAAAGAFNMNFEWLAAYIATVSETTRQEATSIGTAFNTLIARLHSIRTTGFNSEDETKINDIQKALKNINITLLDQEGNWRDMTVIFSEIADQWDTLDGKTKSYIATTMAGVKQQNVFLALMEDLSKHAEGQSRAYELYGKAMESANVAQEKYAVYTDSVKAAQERLTVAQERFYSLLDASLIKDWYNGLAGIVNMINQGTDALKGWNVYLPLIAGGIATIVAVTKNFETFLDNMIEKHPTTLAIAGIAAGVTALIGVLSWLGDVIDTESEKYKRASDRLDESMGKIKSYNGLKLDAAQMFKELEDGTISAKDGLDQYNDTLDRLAQISPVAKKAVDQLKSGLGDQQGAVETLNKEMERAIDLQTQLAMISLRDKYLHWDSGEDSIKMSGYMQTFEGNGGTGQIDTEMFASAEAFAEKIKSTWERAGGKAYFSEAERNFITAQLKDLRDMAYDDRWKFIGQAFWENFFGGGEMKPVTDVMKDQVNTMIEDVMSSVGVTMDGTEAGVFRQRLMDAILGENGELEISEYKNAGKVISNMLADVIANGFEVTDAERLEYVGTQLFGESFHRIAGSIENLIADDPELAGSISEAYQELLKAGFDNDDIRNILEDTPVSKWGDMVQMMKDDLKSGWEDIYNAFGLNLSELFGDEWEDVDFETMKQIPDLYEMDATAIEDVIAAAQGSESLQDFIDKIKEMNSVTGEDEKKLSRDEQIKKINEYASKIKEIDSIIKNISEGKNAGFKDVFELSASHPELLKFINDTEKLKKALEDLRRTVKDQSREGIQKFLMEDEEYFKGTEYYRELDDEMKQNITTMSQYLDYVGEESDAYKEATEEIDAAVEGLVNLSEQTEKTSVTLEDAKNKVKGYSTEIKSIDDILKKFDEGKTVSINDVFELGTSHPELLQYTEDADSLRAALERLREEIKKDAETSIKDALLGDEKFFKSTGYYANLDEERKGSITTLQQYMDTLDKESDEYISIVNWLGNVVSGLVNLQDAEESAGDSTEDYTKTIKAATQEMDKLDKMLKSLDKNGTVDFEDLLNLAAAHPEIIAAITDVNALKETLEGLKRTHVEDVLSGLRQMMMDSKEAMENSPFAGTSWTDEEGVEHTAETMQDIYDNAQYLEAELIESMQDYLTKAVASFVASTDQLGNVGKDVLGVWMESLFPDSNVDLLNRKAVQLGDDIATVLTETITASAGGHEGIKWNQDIVCNFTPITPDGKLLDEETFNSYIDELFAKSENLEELKENDKIANGGRGLLISATTDFESFKEGIAQAESLAELLHLLQEAFYGVAEAEETWLETAMKKAEQDEQNNWAKQNGYLEQLSQIQSLMEQESAQAAIDYFDNLNDTIKQGIANTYPGVIKQLGQMERALKDNANGSKNLTKETESLNRALNKAKEYANAKYFKDSAKAIKGLEEGTVGVADAYNTFYKECNKVTKAQEDINDVTEKMSKKTKVTVSDVSNLAGVLGLSAEEILNDFPGAVDTFNQLLGAGGELQGMFDALNDAAFIKITGTSDADFSAISAGLLSVQNLADETVEKLIATGQWQVETLTLPQEGFVFDPLTGKWTKSTINAHQSVLKPTGKNPFKGGSGGGGGGGGGGKKDKEDTSSKNQMTEVERMLNIMQQIDDIQSSQQNFYQAQQKYYSQTGQLQGVIAYNKLEIDVLKEQNKTFDENLERIESYMDAKKAELSTLTEADEAYEEVADDLDKLQKAHQKYTKGIIDNNAAIETLTESIKEQQRKIRQMEIDLRNTILEAIKDREAKIESMLSAEIEMENKILDLIKQRYEKERDQILEVTNQKIDALREERDLLSEQLQLRKEQAEEEDKSLKLAQLEAQYARISADPTRKKEALSIQKEIDDLREEMAWDAAEKEVEAQQEAIDQQIGSLEDYTEYIENYYSDLLEHPKKLIEEMKSIIILSDEEIIEWLKRNDEEYQEATDNTQTQMINGWASTLMDMRGEIQDHWDEVEKIIAQGDEYIIEFLKQNSADYASAGKLQAEAYVEEWQKKLDDLKRAHEKVVAEIAASYVVIEPPNSGGGSDSDSSGGGGGGGGGNKGGNKKNWLKEVGEKIKEGIDKTSGKATDKISGLSSVFSNQKPTSGGKLSVGSTKLMKYDTGGIADFTGPAWLDGTKELPERILSPYQTKLFETMVEALDRATKVNFTPTLPNMSNIQNMNASPVNVGDIIVNVDRLDSDEDYEEMAERVSDVLMERIGRTTAVGGLRISSY